MARPKSGSEDAGSRYVLTPEYYDGVVSALVGNGELCTTLGPTGYHTPPDQQTDIAHRTQHFVMAGRRRSGSLHPLINFGTLSCSLKIDGLEPHFKTRQQKIDVNRDIPGVETRLDSDGIMIVTTTSVSLLSNVAWYQTVFLCTDLRPHDLDLKLSYTLSDANVNGIVSDADSGVHLAFEIENHLGNIFFGTRKAGSEADVSIERNVNEVGCDCTIRARIQPQGLVTITSWLHFSDRISYEFPQTIDRVIGPVLGSGPAWFKFNERSKVITGHESIDQFRDSTLYTLRSQATPWSIPPTVSEEYWGAGTFHDEMYPFLGLLSSNQVELAERVPYFRLTTLPQAMQRARGRGALYPWSSTEYGEERDPNGLWLTERFHLGQFAVCIWMLWLYNRDLVQLDDLYPVLREIARYFEMNMLECDENGRLRTKACVDFDESVGAVTNGPFTICAAIASMEYAANAAEILSKDALRIPKWRELAGELRKNLPGTDERFEIPDGKPLHYSILSPIFPFRIDVDSPRAVASAEYIHKVCRSTKGWKPGFSEVFEGSNWIWAAAHLGIVHALQGNGNLAWEAIKEAPASAGPFLSPNEHVDKDGVIHVPWFTTGCGAWLYALNCLFVQVDEEGTKLLPAIPSELRDFHFRDLRGDSGILVSGRFADGKLVELTARGPKQMDWRYRVPRRFAEEVELAGKKSDGPTGYARIEVELLGGDPTSLIIVK
jgi:hypothetical protein